VSKQPRNTKQRDHDRAVIRRTRAACHICDKAIDYSLPHAEPKSFVVDHVIPLAKGGADTLNYKAAAHRDFNSTKCARLIAPVVRRSGSGHR
jgi:5-methylcytosine-specific restriction endonuclease McrA